MNLSIIFGLLILSTISLGAPIDFHYLSCDVSLAKNYTPDARCTKVLSSTYESQEKSEISHQEMRAEYLAENPNFQCSVEDKKDRTYKQTFTICHSEDKLLYRIFVTSIPRDYRAVVFLNGIVLPWHEKRVAYFIHDKFFNPKEDYQTWLLP